jgi:hypothetical protein
VRGTVARRVCPRPLTADRRHDDPECSIPSGHFNRDRRIAGRPRLEHARAGSSRGCTAACGTRYGVIARCSLSPLRLGLPHDGPWLNGSNPGWSDRTGAHTCGGFGAAVAAVLVAALALVALVFVLSLSLATAQERTVEAMRDGAPAATRWAAGSGSRWACGSSRSRPRRLLHQGACGLRIRLAQPLDLIPEYRV